jgi:hypothetical protein
MEIALKIMLACCTLVSVAAALYNLVTVHIRAKQRDYENRQAAQLEATTALAIRTQERVTGLESRVGSFEQRVEKRLDQMGSDITKVKDLFTDYLLKQ